MLRRSQRGFWNFVIPAAASVVGGLLSKKSSDSSTAAAQESHQQSLELQREMNQANLDAQKEFAQHGVRWKVEDAKAAGLHPLFGAGLTGATFSPSFQAVQQPRPVRQPEDFSWVAQLGQLMGQFLNNPDARAAQVDEARRQSGGQSVSIVEYPNGSRVMTMPVSGLESQVQGVPLDAPMYNVDLGETRTRPMRDPFAKGHISTAPFQSDPFWQRFAFGPKFDVILPKTSEPQEVFEDKPLWFWAMVAKANVREYGLPWLHQARQQFPSLREVYDGVVQELKQSGLWFGK